MTEIQKLEIIILLTVKMLQIDIKANRHLLKLLIIITLGDLLATLKMYLNKNLDNSEM